MKSLIKLSVAALLVVGSTQVSANDGQLDLTQTLSNSISSYIENTSNELQSKLKESLLIDSQNMLNSLLSEPVENVTDVAVINTKEQTASLVTPKVEG
ncbi:hypothetical protein [Pseudoalteromonas sp. H105]|jgi:hypothetical protein|uniref:hypothetical protein n=1 Tax=Pseudoalteromonas sp. H105 TaxID=1348393 RepID=UPI0007323D6B|nr:hypothetical protein [Pseudoalteromonas sp. H105]KTF16775.1 hypothetical protein ATS75_04835 [Pseudoalteromonas sp. H105]